MCDADRFKEQNNKIWKKKETGEQVAIREWNEKKKSRRERCVEKTEKRIKWSTILETVPEEEQNYNREKDQNGSKNKGY